MDIDLCFFKEVQQHPKGHPLLVLVMEVRHIEMDIGQRCWKVKILQVVKNRHVRDDPSVLPRLFLDLQASSELGLQVCAIMPSWLLLISSMLQGYKMPKKTVMGSPFWNLKRLIVISTKRKLNTVGFHNLCDLFYIWYFGISCTN